MGQQQLLLLVLGTIIVGLAIVIGISAFTNNAVKANEDAVRQDILHIAGRLELHYLAPVELGGSGHRFLTSLTFPDIGLVFNQDGSNAESTYTNSNGSYSLSVEGNTVTISGAGNESGVSLSYTCTVNTTTKRFSLAEVMK
jgi:hypothetical protein